MTSDQEELDYGDAPVMPANKPDSLIPYPDGRLKLTLDGKPYTLRRPTIGEQWDFDDAYATVIALEKEDLEWARGVLTEAGQDVEEGPLTIAVALNLVRTIDPHEAAKHKRTRQEALLGWWLSIFAKLGSNLPELAMGDLPPFLTDFTNVTLAQEAWARNPQGPGDD